MLSQPENVSVDEEVEILTVPVDADLFLQVAITSMCFLWSSSVFLKHTKCTILINKRNVFHCLIYWLSLFSVVSIV